MTAPTRRRNGLFSNLFNINNKKEKQNNEQIVPENLYTLLGFKDRKDFEDQLNNFIKKETWSLFIKCFENEVDHPKLKAVAVVEFVMHSIVEKCLDNEKYKKINFFPLYGNINSKERKKTITKILDLLKKIDPDQAFNELPVIKKHAKDSFGKYKANLEKFYNKPSEELSKHDKEAGLETCRQVEFYEGIFKYTRSLGKLAKVKREELIENFLLNRVSSLSTKHPKLLAERKKAMKILAQMKWASVSEQSIEWESIEELAKLQSTGEVSIRLESVLPTEDSKKIDSLIRLCTALSKSLSNKQGTLEDEDLVAVLVYENAINHCVNSISEETRNSPNVEKFRKILDSLYKERDVQQVNENIGTALTCLVNMQAYIEREKVSDVPTKLNCFSQTTHQTNWVMSTAM